MGEYVQQVSGYWTEAQHACFCLAGPSPIDPASPKLQQAVQRWFSAALEMLRAGGWELRNQDALISQGLGIPIVLMNHHLHIGVDRLVYGTESWPDQPQYLACALEAMEWLLLTASAATESMAKTEFVLRQCRALAASLSQGKPCAAWGA